jgi:hypothetical protein
MTPKQLKAFEKERNKENSLYETTMSKVKTKKHKK